MKASLLKVLAVIIMMVAAISVTTEVDCLYASTAKCPECNWGYLESFGPSYYQYNSKKHRVEYIRLCSICEYKEVTKTTYEDHKMTRMDCYGYEYVDADQHEYKYDETCQCGIIVTKTASQKHNSNENVACTTCEFPKRSGTVTLGEGKWIGFKGRPYLKIKVTKPGIIRIKSTDDGIIYNSKKKPLKHSRIRYDSQLRPTWFAVKKGTYYLRTIKGEGQDNQKVKYEFESVSCKNTTKSKAVKLGKNKWKKVMFFSSKKNLYRWYKIKVNRKSKIKLYVRGDIYCENIEVYNSKGKYVTWFGDWMQSSDAYEVSRSNKSLKPGTYYLRIGNSGVDLASLKMVGDSMAGQFKWK